MKKILMAVILSVLTVTLFISCGKPEDNPESSIPSSSGPVESKPAPAESEPAVPVESEPAVPVESEPAVPVESEPTEPAESEPAAPVESEPPEPAESEPPEPAESEPPEPAVSEPPEPAVSEPPEPSESEPSEPEEDPARQLAEMNAAELFNYACVVQASLDGYTVQTDNEMKFNYAGQKGSYLYTALVQTEGLTGKSPMFSVKSVRNLDGTESTLNAAFMNGYYYKDNGKEKVKSPLAAGQIPLLLGEHTGATAKLSGSVFKALKKTETAGGWLVTGTGLVSGKSDDILNGLLNAFDLGTTASEISLTSFQVETSVNKLGQVTLQKTSFLFTMDYSGINLSFEIQSKVAYSAMNSTRTNISVNPGEYIEGK